MNWGFAVPFSKHIRSITSFHFHSNSFLEILLLELYLAKEEAETQVSNLPQGAFQEVAKLELKPEPYSSKPLTLTSLIFYNKYI